MYFALFNGTQMKKIIILFTAISLCANLHAQLEVADTVFLADKNDNYWSSSSELEPGAYTDIGKYGATNLSDSDPSTCWAEGSIGDGVGEYVLLTIPNNTTQLRIRNGYQKNKNIYLANNRPKTIELSVCAFFQLGGYVTETHTGFSISEPLCSTVATLEDQFDYQDLNMNIDWMKVHEQLTRDNTFDKDQFILKIKILDVYKGNKWNDACISDIHVIPSPYFSLTDDEQGFVKVYELKTDTLFYNPESIFQVLEISKDAQWIIFIEMPADIENSRGETIYKLFNTNQEKFIELDDMFQMYGFIIEDDKTYIEGLDRNLEEITILLDTND